MKTEMKLMAMALVATLLSGVANAAVITEDFEDATGWTWVNEFKTKAGTVTSIADPRTGSAGSNSVQFNWASDGPNNTPRAWMVMNLAQDTDFTGASFSYWSKRTNRVTHTALELWDNGVLVEKWQVTASPGVWAERTGTQGGGFSPGGGDITSIDQIRFKTLFNGAQTSGLNHTVQFDDLVITGVTIPEPASMALLGLGGLAILTRRRKI